MSRRDVIYAREPSIGVAEFRHVLVDSGLASIRPVDDVARMQALIDGANVIVTARLDTAERPLVGLVRGITDHAWCCYISDVAVCTEAQGLGVGRGLLDAVRHHLGPVVTILLVSVPDAVRFYEKAGMEPVANTFWSKRTR